MKFLDMVARSWLLGFGCELNPGFEVDWAWIRGKLLIEVPHSHFPKLLV